MNPNNSPTSSQSSPTGPLGRFLANWPEIPWLVAALIGWWLMGFLLAPFTATYGPEFLHKAFVTAVRLAIAITLTELAVAICFPSVRKWVRDGRFSMWFQAGSLVPEIDTQKVKLVTAVHLVIFAAVMVSLSL